MKIKFFLVYNILDIYEQLNYRKKLEKVINGSRGISSSGDRKKTELSFGYKNL